MNLTQKQERLFKAVEEKPMLAYDLAQKAEVDNRAAGSVLSSLVAKGLILRDYDQKLRAYVYRRREAVT